VRCIVNRTIAEYGEWNYHWKTLVNALRNKPSLRNPSKMNVFHAKRISQVAKSHRMWNAHGLSNWICWMKRLAIKIYHNFRVDESKERPTWSFLIFSPYRMYWHLFFGHAPSVIKKFKCRPVPKNCCLFSFDQKDVIRYDLQNIEIRSEYLSPAVRRAPMPLVSG
jgi:hypothetical protein